MSQATEGNKGVRLLVVDDEPDLRTLYELTLLREGYDVDCADSVHDAWQAMQERAYQLVITDMRLTDGLGLDLLRRMEAADRPERAIVITAYASPENAVEALKAGAFDYLTKPVDLRQFRSVVASALGRQSPPLGGLPAAPASSAAPPAPHRHAAHDAKHGESLGAHPELAANATATSPRPPAAPVSDQAHAALARLVGGSGAMQQVRAMVQKVGRSMAPVLVNGESGTGKELVARAIHLVSARSAGPFVPVNCGAIPENLLEAEFFGYRKGAFTGATEDRDGFFQAAQGGTLFLDEVGDLPLAMQSKLLRVIQERAVRPVGAVSEVPTQVRVLSATHKDLGQEVLAGRFRQDLYYRLNVIHIRVPPLRERLVDLPAICDVLLARMSRDAGVAPAPTMSARAMDLLGQHPFPGNVRELENLLHRALALANGPHIDAADLGLVPDAREEDTSGEASPVPTRSVEGAHLASAHPPLPNDLAQHLDAVERELLERALIEQRYNRTAAGARLGLSLRQMRYRMARLGIAGADGSTLGPGPNGEGR